MVIREIHSSITNGNTMTVATNLPLFNSSELFVVSYQVSIPINTIAEIVYQLQPAIYINNEYEFRLINSVGNEVPNIGSLSFTCEFIEFE